MFRRELDKGTLLLCIANEDAEHTLLSCTETKKKWRMQFMCKKCICVNEKLACRKIKNCTDKAHIIHRGEYLDNVKNKRENKVKEVQ